METYHGHVRTPADAIILFEACRLGVLPRVQRRLSEKERQSIKSGSVFVWDEREAGMRRWTDGKSWSASRVSGSFLTYREMEGKRGGGTYNTAVQRAGKTPDSTRGSDSDVDMGGDEGQDGYRYKPDGLMKQSFSITTSTGNHLHLISYYSRSSPAAQQLQQPSNDPALRHIRPQKGMYPESTVSEPQSIPAVTRAPMGMPMGAGVPPPAMYRGGPPMPPHGMPPYQAGPPPPGQQWPGGPTSQANGYPPQQYPPSTLAPPHPGVALPGVAPPPPGYPPQQAPPPAGYGPPPQAMPPLTQGPTPPHHPASTSSPMVGNATLPPPGGHHRTNSGGKYPQYPANLSPHTSVASLATSRPGSQHASQNNSPATTPPMSQIDPRLGSHPSPLGGRSLPPVNPAGMRTRTPSPSPLQHQLSGPTSGPPHGLPPTSAAQPLPQLGASTIPSINQLVNAEGAGPAGMPGRSPSPALSGIDGPKDIPHEKISFHEDVRALRVLDRAFKT